MGVINPTPKIGPEPAQDSLRFGAETTMSEGLVVIASRAQAFTGSSGVASNCGQDQLTPAPPSPLGAVGTRAFRRHLLEGRRGDRRLGLALQRYAWAAGNLALVRGW